MTKKNLTTRKRLTQNAVLMDTVKKRITDAATSTVPEVLSRLSSRLTGLSENEIREQRTRYGKNAITKGKKKSWGYYTFKQRRHDSLRCSHS